MVGAFGLGMEGLGVGRVTKCVHKLISVGGPCEISLLCLKKLKTCKPVVCMLFIVLICVCEN